MKITHPVTRATLGVAALVAIALLANWLVSLTPLGNRGIDLTERNIHTLSDGTRAILKELDTQVVVRYYATRSSDYMPEEMKLHMRRVDDLLKEYASLSNGKLLIEHLDPEPDTDAEDAAQLDGISGERINDQNTYFGMAISCLDRTSVIPFINPREETMLEYTLTKAIAEVSNPTKPKVGLMAGIEMKGSPPMMMGQQGSAPWVIYQQLQQSFEVVDVPMDGAPIDPAQIKVLLLVHPAGITPQAEFAIDQYILKGGTVVACLDAHSVAAQMQGGGNPMMGMAGTPTASTLPTLLPAWGVEFESGMTLADPSYATRFADNRVGIAVLSLPKEAMPDKDDVVTGSLDSVIFFLPGGFSRKDECKLGYRPMLRSSTRAGFVDSMRASNLDPALQDEFKSSGRSYDLVTHLSGRFKTAFPDGDPSKKEQAADNKDGQKDEAKGDETQTASLKEAVADGNVFLIADIDAFFDQFAYSVRNMGGMRMATPNNGNAPLLFNLLDQSVGSKHLIGARSRAATRRPFSVIQKMEDEFNRNAGARVAELREKERATMDKLNELQVRKTRGKELYLSPEQEAEISKLRSEQVKYGKQIREQQKELQRQKDTLTGNITLLNVAVMPTLVILTGLGLYLERRRSTRAR